MQIKNETLDIVIGDVFKQPLHKSLRQYRIMSVIVLFCSIDIMYRLLGLLAEANKLSDGQHIAAIVGLATALMTAIWKGISNLSDSHHQDFQ